MDDRTALTLIARIKKGETPDFIQLETGFTPKRQHKVIRTYVARVMLKASRSMREVKEYPFNRGLLDYREWDAALVKIETWMKTRELKREYDRMTEADKAKNKECYARQIDAMLFYHRAAYELADGTFDSEAYKLEYGPGV